MSARTSPSGSQQLPSMVDSGIVLSLLLLWRVGEKAVAVMMLRRVCCCITFSRRLGYRLYPKRSTCVGPKRLFDPRHVRPCRSASRDEIVEESLDSWLYLLVSEKSKGTTCAAQSVVVAVFHSGLARRSWYNIFSKQEFFGLGQIMLQQFTIGLGRYEFFRHLLLFRIRLSSCPRGIHGCWSLVVVVVVSSLVGKKDDSACLDG